MAFGRWRGSVHSLHDSGPGQYEPLTQIAGAIPQAEQGSLANPPGNPGNLAGTSSLPGNSSPPEIPHPGQRPAPGTIA